MFKFIILTMLLIPLGDSYSAGDVSKSYSKDNAQVYIISPKNNEIVTNPIKIIFGVSGMKIVPSGVDENFSGHHHLLINVKELPDLSKPIPSDKNHLHFGKGQNIAEINLQKGKHTLQLLLGDYMHVPHVKPIYSDKITIMVK